MIHNISIPIRTTGDGLFEITPEIQGAIHKSGISSGLCTIFIQHTSASLLIQENADPSAKRDLEAWLKRLVPENDPHYTHVFEGPDDMPSHIKAALTQTSIGIPVVDSELCLGTWQGVYLWEHRTSPHARRIIVNLIGEDE
jgi:secondary thiamine-phosphate synthase enzyme